MKVSKETSARHREALLGAASRLFRDKGFDKVGIAEIAAAAGLTHGAFYTHFASKDELCAEAATASLRRGAETLHGSGDRRAYIEAYLSPRHVRDRRNGCPIAAFSGDVPREGPRVRAAFSQGLDHMIDTVSDGLGEPSRDRAIASLATMVGALVLARAAAEPSLRDEILDAARATLLDPAGR
jgi:TetR/AcrR family transcriptional repressor of nem operon